MSPLNETFAALHEEEDDQDTVRAFRDERLNRLGDIFQQGRTDLLVAAKRAAGSAKKLDHRPRKIAREEFYRLIFDSIDYGGSSFLHTFAKKRTSAHTICRR